MNRVCVDSGFLIALYDEADEHHKKAEKMFKGYFESSPNQLLVPWPILYETISTRMTRNCKKINAIQRDWKLLNNEGRLIQIDDKEFRDGAFDECLKEVNRGHNYRALSLPDRVIRKILSEVNIKKDYFITFNTGDFADVCKKYGISLVDK